MWLCSISEKSPDQVITLIGECKKFVCTGVVSYVINQQSMLYVTLAILSKKILLEPLTKS